jgi:hypothetical protein
LVNLTDHVFKLLDKFILVASFVSCVVWVLKKLVFQEVIVPLFARSDVSFGIREQIVRTERAQVVLADVRVIEVIAACQPDEQRLVPVLAHELVEFLLNVIHT